MWMVASGGFLTDARYGRGRRHEWKDAAVRLLDHIAVNDDAQEDGAAPIPLHRDRLTPIPRRGICQPITTSLRSRPLKCTRRLGSLQHFFDHCDQRRRAKRFWQNAVGAQFFSNMEEIEIAAAAAA